MSSDHLPDLYTPEHNRHLLALLIDLWDHPRQEALQRVMHELAHGSAKLYVGLKHGERCDPQGTRVEQLEVIPLSGEPVMPTLLSFTTIERFPGLPLEPSHLGRVPTPQLLRFCDELGITNVALHFEFTRAIFLRRNHSQEPFRIHCSQFDFWDAQPEKPLSAMTRKERLARLKRR